MEVLTKRSNGRDRLTISTGETGEVEVSVVFINWIGGYSSRHLYGFGVLRVKGVRHRTWGREEYVKFSCKQWDVNEENKCKVIFSKYDSEIVKDGKVIGRGIRKKGLYVMKLGTKPEDKICLVTIDENSALRQRRLGYANMRLIQSLASKELVRNLSKLKFDQHFCDACKIGKQAHASHKAKNVVSTTRCLELLHMDLFGPSAIRSYG
ncbi:retrovirus-related pol polyprotein from transposon TNT 1-94 [Tanacetum coccineum]|uniref:Retrovirus-related pol polyprotein from transposon TNT 1-94 n=1 Tax=Tanacetum coccineum TaxID=301880 RepID=A0ABQ5BDH8_9ASTR